MNNNNKNDDDSNVNFWRQQYINDLCTYYDYGYDY